MAHQAALNGGSRVRINSPFVEGVLGNLAEFGGDIATLAELQAQLAARDLKESASRAALPAVGVAVAAALALGCVPILLFGVAELLVLAGMKLAWALIVTGAVALTLAGLIGWLS